MELMKYIFINVFATLLRLVPLPCKTGLIKVGNPGKNSPVFLTCNYLLTAERVRKALKDIDCYLLIGNSRGINVWCGSAGGHFTNHSVISVLRTSGIEELVNHRNVILPQLAAIGVEARTIRKKSGWKVAWGPVYAKDIPLFIKNKHKKPRKIRETLFPWLQRIEMCVAWAFPISILLVLIMYPFWPEAVFPLIFLVWCLSFVIFLSVPTYQSWLRFEGKGIAFIGQLWFPIILWCVFMLGLVAYSIFVGDFTWGFIFRWGLISFITTFLLSIDLRSSTPLFKSGIHENRFKIIIDENKCKGAGFCEEVCPRNCYEVDRDRHTATMPMADRCVQCGACIVQCPFDALYFKSPTSEIITPETVRRFKLNFTGKRLVKLAGNQGVFPSVKREKSGKS